MMSAMINGSRHVLFANRTTSDTTPNKGSGDESTFARWGSGLCCGTRWLFQSGGRATVDSVTIGARIQGYNAGLERTVRRAYGALFHVDRG